MKNWIFAILASVLFLGTAHAADTGLWYDPERDGEGINVITRNSTLVFFFYTYRDNVHLIPPSVSPDPPSLVPEEPNTPIWYMGQAEDYDGKIANGTLYTGEALDYPNAVETSLASVEEVGTFTLFRDGDGWILEINYSWNYLVPWFVSLYDVHNFPVALITK